MNGTFRSTVSRPPMGSKCSAANNHLFTCRAHNLRERGTIHMAETAKRPLASPDRRRAGRAALSLTATMREGSRSKVQVRIIDISTHGCRIECTSAVSVDANVWLTIPGLENQYCRVVWHCQ